MFLSNYSQVLFALASAIRKNFFKKTRRDGCIRESFVGNYPVDYEPGAHIPAMTPRSLKLLLLPGEVFAKVQR